jgi:ISXO2-like transposase domain
MRSNLIAGFSRSKHASITFFSCAGQRDFAVPAVAILNIEQHRVSATSAACANISSLCPPEPCFTVRGNPCGSGLRQSGGHSTSKTSVSASALKEFQGLGSYQTAWCWLQKLQTCAVFPNRAQFTGNIEVDEFYLGGQRGRGTDHKCKVAVAGERQGRKLGRLRLQVIASSSAEEFTSFAKANIDRGSQVTTDGWAGYSGLIKEGLVHGAVNQSNAEDKNSVLPVVHLVTSLFKRVILGTFQGRFEPQYLRSKSFFRQSQRTLNPAQRTGIYRSLYIFKFFIESALSIPPIA